mmetsp:Transcript_15370/g.35636  ORF Transcript_15370/g.35636 Transcript_15370/m.35636 type:complete len:312 (+) Transcript_15370:134-1069(+)
MLTISSMTSTKLSLKPSRTMPWRIGTRSTTPNLRRLCPISTRGCQACLARASRGGSQGAWVSHHRRRRLHRRPPPQTWPLPSAAAFSAQRRSARLPTGRARAPPPRHRHRARASHVASCRGSGFDCSGTNPSRPSPPAHAAAAAASRAAIAQSLSRSRRPAERSPPGVAPSAASSAAASGRPSRWPSHPWMGPTQSASLGRHPCQDSRSRPGWCCCCCSKAGCCCSARSPLGCTSVAALARPGDRRCPRPKAGRSGSQRAAAACRSPARLRRPPACRRCCCLAAAASRPAGWAARAARRLMLSVEQGPRQR